MNTKIDETPEEFFNWLRSEWRICYGNHSLCLEANFSGMLRVRRKEEILWKGQLPVNAIAAYNKAVQNQ